MNIKKLLKQYEIEIEFFDLEVFEDEIMLNILCLIKKLYKNINNLNIQEKILIEIEILTKKYNKF